MHIQQSATGRRRRSRLHCAGALVASALVAALLTTQCAVAGGEPSEENIAAPTLQPVPRPTDGADDGFVPISRLAPRTKIVLREKERLPDLGGQATFAESGKYVMSLPWVDRNPPVPMYPFCYNPIYFEDMNLERCGLSCGCCLEPVISGIHFYASVALLPYKMLNTPPCSCVCPPGECPPGFGFSHCENVFGPAPDFKGLFRRGSLAVKRDGQ